MNRKTVIFVLITFLPLLIIGYLLNNQRYLNSQRSSSIISTQQPFLTPTSAYKNDQKFEDLIWKKYYSQDLGVSFEYPENLDHFSPPEENPTSLRIQENLVKISSGMSYIFSIGKLITNENVEEHLKEFDYKNESKFFKTTKTSFRNKIAYYVEDKQNGQVPYDSIYLPFNGYYLIINFSKLLVSQDVETACRDNRNLKEVIIKNQCDANMVYRFKDFYEYFARFDNLIINRILNSIEFIR